MRNISRDEPPEVAFVKVNPSLKHVTKQQAIHGIDAAFFNNDTSFFDGSVLDLGFPGLVGGMAPVDSGMSGDGAADLSRPGTYVYVCAQFDQASGKLHYELGMLGLFREN